MNNIAELPCSTPCSPSLHPTLTLPFTLPSFHSSFPPLDLYFLIKFIVSSPLLRSCFPPSTPFFASLFVSFFSHSIHFSLTLSLPRLLFPSSLSLLLFLSFSLLHFLLLHLQFSHSSIAPIFTSSLSFIPSSFTPQYLPPSCPLILFFHLSLLIFCVIFPSPKHTTSSPFLSFLSPLYSSLFDCLFVPPLSLQSPFSLLLSPSQFLAPIIL